VSSSHYDFHGVTIAVESEVSAVAEAIDARFRPFRTDDGRTDVLFRFHVLKRGEDHRVPQAGGVGVPVYDPPVGSVRYYPDDDVLLIDSGDDRIRASCRPAEGRVDVSIARNDHDVWLLSRPLVTLPLIEILKRRGVHSVHASAVAKEGRCVLLPGPTGSGKTTLAVALARTGFDLVADDMVFIRPEATSVLGFPDELDVSERTVELLPELALAGVREDGWPKLRVRPERVCAVATEPTEPKLLIFPRLGVGPRSVLEPVSSANALRELAPNVLLTQPAPSQEHLAALGALVERSRCYSLQAARGVGQPRATGPQRP
jgi:hypothetical protein